MELGDSAAASQNRTTKSLGDEGERSAAVAALTDS
jgi:hypothetical protein